jgi:2-polyprenyl-6-hydroxyphenyl methylase/3-demethylubiquinone-9 3-methyltransferase
MFKFGENWASFSRQLDEARIEAAMKSLVSLFGEEALRGRSFLDIGCGSGLFSIAAVRLGANRVVGLDVDPVSVSTSQANAAHWLAGSASLFSFQLISALDTTQMEALGRFDIVYSWGVLHHTGNMARSLQNAAQRVDTHGLFMIAIYNKHWSSLPWKFIKWLYNRANSFGQKLLVWIFTPVIFAAKFVVTFENPLTMKRGMDFMHNIIDWVGGYPYEYASIPEITETLKQLGFEMQVVRPAAVPTGCNEFVSRKTG